MTSTLRERLVSTIRDQFEKELADSVARMQAAIEPYAEFVRAEHAHAVGSTDILQTLAREAVAIREEIRRLPSSVPGRVS